MNYTSEVNFLMVFQLEDCDGPFEALHCRILDVFRVIILLQELSSFHLQLVFFEQTV